MQARVGLGAREDLGAWSSDLQGVLERVPVTATALGPLGICNSNIADIWISFYQQTWVFSALVLGAQWVTILTIKAQFSRLLFRPNLQFCTRLATGNSSAYAKLTDFVILCPASYATEKKEVLLVCLPLVAIMWSSALCHQLVLKVVLIATTARAPKATTPFECRDTPSQKLNSKLLCYSGSTSPLTIPLPCTHSCVLLWEHRLQVLVL